MSAKVEWILTVICFGLGIFVIESAYGGAGVLDLWVLLGIGAFLGTGIALLASPRQRA